mmetsp:Transcript_13593/g.19011  ORF Transcript_13593/g.19011 Transcript_13593/m.19011 type:complete len:179 (+) Transcript_13593:462-998(+)
MVRSSHRRKVGRFCAQNPLPSISMRRRIMRLLLGLIFLTFLMGVVHFLTLSESEEVKVEEVEVESGKNDIYASSCSEQPKELQGMMTQPEQTFLKTFLKSDSTYFEWGSGGSTDTFGRLTNAKIVSVENYQPWCDKVSELPFVKCRQQLKTIDYKCIVPHPTGGAGYPVDHAHTQWRL